MEIQTETNKVALKLQKNRLSSSDDDGRIEKKNHQLFVVLMFTIFLGVKLELLIRLARFFLRILPHLTK